MRAVVVGAGIDGASAAFALASEGHDVTLLERFTVDHDRGSSFGDSRIIRRFYDDPYYTQLIPQSFALWRRLERLTSRTLYEQLGGLYFGPADHPNLASAMRGLQAAGATPVLLPAAELRQRFPAFAFDDDQAGLVDEQAGSLRASHCVQATVDAAVAAGAALETNAVVRAIERGASGSGVVIVQDGNRRTFDRAVICAGPWTNRLLPHMQLPLRVTRQQYIHLAPTRDDVSFEPGRMPIFIDAETLWYGFPRHGGIAGVKLASHIFGDTVDPDHVDRAVDSPAIERTRAYAACRLPALANGKVVYGKTCLYTVTPDEDFIVDRVAGIDGCVFASACSGHGFKFGPLIGAVLADLALDRAPRADISRFRAARFANA